MPVFRPGKPFWILSQSANQTVVGGSTTDLEWDDVIAEDGDFSLSATTVTVELPGLYLLGWQVTRVATATASPMVVRLRQAGATLLLNQGINTANAHTLTGTRLLWLPAADDLVINVTLHNTLTTTTSAPSTEWWGVRVGPVRWT